MSIVKASTYIRYTTQIQVHSGGQTYKILRYTELSTNYRWANDDRKTTSLAILAMNEQHSSGKSSSLLRIPFLHNHSQHSQQMPSATNNKQQHNRWRETFFHPKRCQALDNTNINSELTELLLKLANKLKHLWVFLKGWVVLLSDDHRRQKYSYEKS